MKNKTDSKERMLAAATRLFQTKGYNATGLREILEESNSPKGSLYYYFPEGKEELAVEALKEARQTICTKIRTTMKKATDAAAGITAAIDDMKGSIGKEGRLQELSLSLIALETYLSSDKLSSACKEAFEELEDIYYDKILEDGYETEAAKELSLTVQAMIEGAITMSIAKKNTHSLEAVKNQVNILLKYRKK